MQVPQLKVVEEVSATLFNASENTKYLALASCAIYLYDYLLTFEQEVEFFWSGKWSTTRLLFLTNRYLSPVVLLTGLYCLLGTNLSDEYARRTQATYLNDNFHSCSTAVPGVFVLDCLAIAVVQMIIVIRIWYIYSEHRVAQTFFICAFIGCFCSAAKALGSLFPDLRQTTAGYNSNGCGLMNTNGMWKMLLPNLILHTILYLATTFPALRLHHQGKQAPLVNRLVRDGGVFYIFVFASSAFTTIGTLQPQQLSVFLPAVYSNSLLAISSVSVSRLMISVRSLASSLSMDRDLLLSATELSRVRWRKGSREGEIIVDVDTVEGEQLELEDLHRSEPGHATSPAVRITQIGVYDDSFIPARAER